MARALQRISNAVQLDLDGTCWRGRTSDLILTPKLGAVVAEALGTTARSSCIAALLLVEEIFRIIQRLNREEKLTVLLVEQNAAMALTIAEHGYVMENGRIALDGPVAVLGENPDIKEFYLGLTEVGARKSYRVVKRGAPLPGPPPVGWAGEAAVERDSGLGGATWLGLTAPHEEEGP